HAPFCERLRVRFPRPTLQVLRSRGYVDRSRLRVTIPIFAPARRPRYLLEDAPQFGPARRIDRFGPGEAATEMLAKQRKAGAVLSLRTALTAIVQDRL